MEEKEGEQWALSLTAAREWCGVRDLGFGKGWGAKGVGLSG